MWSFRIFETCDYWNSYSAQIGNERVWSLPALDENMKRQSSKCIFKFSDNRNVYCKVKWLKFDVGNIFFFAKKNIIKVYQKSGTELI